MGTLVMSEFITLDGVIQDPAGNEGFARGGWVGARLTLMDLGVPVLLETPLQELIVRDGRVCAVRTAGGEELHARPGVVLAAGGFSRNQAMREEHMRAPTDQAWSLTPEDAEDGSVMAPARQAGAAVELMDQAWGMPSVLVSKGGRQGVALLTLAERGLPGCIVVNRAGERYANEAMAYDPFWQAMYANDRPGAGTVPSWMIFDQRAKNRYIIMGCMPRQPFPRAWLRDGTVRRASSLDALAVAIGVPADRLAGTVERHNGFARAGTDGDFGRGERAYDRFYGDSTLPNPCPRPVGPGAVLRGRPAGGRPRHQRRPGRRRALPGPHPGRRRAPGPVRRGQPLGRA